MNISSRIDAIRDVDLIQLGSFPTPIRQTVLPSGRWIFIKDDGCCASPYGGNKVRKLEYLLADAKRLGKNRLAVWGDIDSHTVSASALLGRKCGFIIDAAIYPHGAQQFYSSELQKFAATDPQLRVHLRGNFSSALLQYRLLIIQRDVYPVPLGASTPLTTVGYVRAALELVEQCTQMGIKLPRTIFVPFATGGTASGLAIGFALLDLPVNIAAVHTVQKFIANRRTARRLIKNTLALLGLDTVLLRHECFSRLRLIEGLSQDRKFRQFSPACFAATSFAETLGYSLEPVFSGKAFAAVLSAADDAADGELLFWNTHDQRRSAESRLSVDQRGSHVE